jgi:two-component system, NtrC family, response regulator AtoC
MEQRGMTRVMIVEDEADVRGYFARALARLIPSLEVMTAADGLEALDLLRLTPCDLILSDQRMPRMTGLELLVALRRCSEVPFVLISADRSVEGAAYAAGANDFLSKPIGLDTLRGAIARHLLRHACA